jgi:hypothetical protein
MAKKKEASSEEKFWAGVIKDWKSKALDHRKEFERYAQTYRSQYYARDGGEGASDSDVTHETNYLYAFADTLTANVVPPNPQVTIVANRQENEEPAKLRTALANSIFHREQLSSKLWKATSRATVWPRSFLKAVWSESHNRPIFRVLNPHYVIFDMQAEDWEDIRYVGELTVLTRADVQRRMKKQGKKGGFYRHDAMEDLQFGAYPNWIEPEDDSKTTGEKPVDVVRSGYEWVVVYEIYDLVGQKMYHFTADSERSLMSGELPYRFLPNPFTMLPFNDNLRDLGGMSDAELVYPNIERLNEMQSLETWHCRTSIPVTVIHEGLVDDPDAFTEAYEQIDGPGQAIAVSAKARVGINEVIGVTPTPTLPVEWDRTINRIKETIDFVLGIPGYMRGAVGQSDVATELALTDTATRTRNARRQKVIYNTIEWCSKAVIALYQERMEPDSKIPIRLIDGAKETELTRELMGFEGDENEDGELVPRGDDPWTYDYSANPYNASEQNDTVVLKQLEVFLPVLSEQVAAGNIDGRKLTKKLLELLHMEELLTDAPPPEAPGAAAPGMEGMMGPETANNMGQQPMVPGSMPGAAAAPMIGGEVAVGTGAQAVPGGMEGGGSGM